MKRLATTLAITLGAALLPSLFQVSVATIMSYPPTIEKLAKDSDLVAKVKVLSIDAGQVDHSLLTTDFWKVKRAHLQIISPIKGSPTNAKEDFVFRSASLPDKPGQIFLDVGPENYSHFDLKPDHCYILFMNQAKGSHGYVQASVNFGMRSWEGFFQSASDAPVAAGSTAQQAIWTELTGSLQSHDKKIQKEAALTLLELSAGNDTSTVGSADYARERVVESILSRKGNPAALCDDDSSLKQLIEALGSASPYRDDSTQMRYFWTKAAKPISAWAQWTASNHLANTPGIAFLIGIADSKHKAAVRAAAILSMGNCQSTNKAQNALPAKLAEWLRSPETDVRAAATKLSADYPDTISPSQLIALCQDKAASVRQSAAYAIGIRQAYQAIPQLAKMLKDGNADVQASAALTVLALPVEKTKSILEENLSNPAFGTAFLARLASADPVSLRDRLLEEMKKPDPIRFPGTDSSFQNIAFQNGIATIPHFLCIAEMHKYLDSLSGTELQKPEYKPYLDGIEAVGAKDPAFTGKVYEILITHRLNQRAAAFRSAATSAQPGLPGIAFQQPDNQLKHGILQYK